MDKSPYQKLFEDINNEPDDDTCYEDDKFYERHNRLLILASENGYLDIVKQIIYLGADVNANDNNNNITALMEASENGHLEIVQFLITNGADVNASDKYNLTALMNAASNGHADIVKLLIENRANVNTINCLGNTALIQVTQNSIMDKETQLDIVKQLIQSGADVNIQDKYNKWTPLMDATSINKLEIVQELLEAGADVNITNINDVTALMIAELNEYNNIATLISQKLA
jgi:ankyrin repeat protein